MSNMIDSLQLLIKSFLTDTYARRLMLYEFYNDLYNEYYKQYEPYKNYDTSANAEIKECYNNVGRKLYNIIKEYENLESVLTDYLKKKE